MRRPTFRIRMGVQQCRTGCRRWMLLYLGFWGLYAGIRTAEAQELMEPVHLGVAINTRAPEILPRISADGQTLYFVRGRTEAELAQGREDQDIWEARRNADGTWQTARSIGPPLNTDSDNAVCGITPDGHTILLSNQYFTDRANRPGVSISRSYCGRWGFPENMEIRNYQNFSPFANFFLAHDGQTMLMELEGPDALGRQDLYVSFLESTEPLVWSPPVNLGPEINTPGFEFSPFLAADNRTLYFSSTGHGGFGLADIWMTRRLDSTWTRWSKPVNLGAAINSPEVDAYFTMPASGEEAFFCSTRESYGEQDIYRILLSDALKPDPVVLIEGVVRDAETDRPIEAVIRYERLPSGKRAGLAHSDACTGQFRVVLPAGNRYGWYAEAEGYMGVNDHLDVSTLDAYEEQERSLKLVPIRAGAVIRLNNIFFDTGKSTLKPESTAELQRVLKLLESHPALIIEIGGHTDNVGTERKNQALSQARAEAVRSYLLRQGISGNRVEARGYGEARPVESNQTPAGRARNRRVEFTILEK